MGPFLFHQHLVLLQYLLVDLSKLDVNITSLLYHGIDVRQNVLPFLLLLRDLTIQLI